MTRKFDQHRVLEITTVLRRHAKNGKRIKAVTALEAADLIEDMLVMIYGIQERFPGMADVETGETL